MNPGYVERSGTFQSSTKADFAWRAEEMEAMRQQVNTRVVGVLLGWGGGGREGSGQSRIEGPAWRSCGGQVQAAVGQPLLRGSASAP